MILELLRLTLRATAAGLNDLLTITIYPAIIAFFEFRVVVSSGPPTSWFDCMVSLHALGFIVSQPLLRTETDSSNAIGQLKHHRSYV
jgi:hypothetical protein